ncbi:hypothetical protein [Xanthomonas graminis]|jgi:hypothetical protein|uniref:hypothetical protein n=1 Tax=Xanthomonas graminis TaxID=3390026 RepID=UPI001F2766C4|nr:hypothetical protein [Xanthomonas translucens]UKE73351.1 hypothetical protein KFS85_20485 [Xanthomonas translucens pv. phleipratensis]
MRDIRPEGDFVVQGDFNLNEGSQAAYVPFEQMGLDDLRANLEHFSKLAREERRRINGISFKLLAVAAAAATALSIWYFIAGKTELAMFLVAIIGVGMPVVFAIKTAEAQSDFEARQLNTMRLLTHLIRERTHR